MDSSLTALGGIGFLTFIISIAVLIVFFIMAVRLRKIMENTNQAAYSYKVRQFYEARAFELAGNNSAALALYYQVLWRYEQTFQYQLKISKEQLMQKIKDLGGDPSIKYNEL